MYKPPMLGRCHGPTILIRAAIITAYPTLQPLKQHNSTAQLIHIDSSTTRYGLGTSSNNGMVGTHPKKAAR